jgi:5S rRNA maturation endonuclease (ribonuclease M5)
MKQKCASESRLLGREKAFRNLLLDLEESGAALLVEGKKDREALQNCGFSNPIFTITRTPDEVARAVSESSGRAAVLTDFDSAGEDLLKRIVPALEAHGVSADTETRRRLRGLFGIRFFEDLDLKVRGLRDELARR